MSGRMFVDTNVILYSKDARDERKQSIAEDLIARGIRDATLVVSTQVLNEFYVNATQKLTPGMHREDARKVCRSLSASCEPVTNETIVAAWDVQDRF
ncbi:MAG: PIN domain-containing protein, partial [Spirochaetaceae bacterium]